MDENKILPHGLNVPDRTNKIRWLKRVLLAAAAIICFAAAWQTLSTGFLRSHELAFWAIPLFLASMGTAFLTLLVMVGSVSWLFIATNLGILLGYVIAMPKNPYVMLGGVIFFLLSFLFEHRIESDEKSRADFSLHRVIHSSVNVMVYGLLILVGFNIYAKLHQEFQNNPQNFYNQIGHYAAEGLDYVPSGLGNFDPNQRFDEFVAMEAAKQDPAFQQASPGEKAVLTGQVRQGLEDRFHLQVSGNPVLGDVVAGWVSEKVQATASSYQRFFPAIFAILIIVFLRWFAFLFVWLTMLVSWLAFRLLLSLNFLRIVKVQVEVDKLQI